MAERVALYLLAHQPRRLRLPVPDIGGLSPAAAETALFDDEMNRRYFERVLRKSYRPTLEVLRALAGAGLRVGLGLSGSLRWQAQRWAPDWLAEADALARSGDVEAVATDRIHGFLFYLDLEAFRAQMAAEAAAMAQRYGRAPLVADTTEMFLTPGIDLALRQAGYRGVLSDGRPGLLGWRDPTFRYRTPAGLALLTRHLNLSDDVGYRFSNRAWEHFPLRVETYAGWLRATPGPQVLLAWDFETFGEHHWEDTGIFEFLSHLPGALTAAGLEAVSPGELVAGPGDLLELPGDGVTWAGEGTAEFFFGNAPQQRIFRLMHDAYHIAAMSEDPAVRSMGLWLTQSDHLHLLQWYGQMGALAEVSAYFTPVEWWPLGAEGIVREMTQAFVAFVRWAAARA